MKRTVLIAVALGFLVAGTAMAQDCAPTAVSAPASVEGAGLPVAPQDAGQCPGNLFETTINYFSDPAKTDPIGYCINHCDGSQTCQGAKSFYISIALACCTN